MIFVFFAANPLCGWFVSQGWFVSKYSETPATATALISHGAAEITERKTCLPSPSLSGLRVKSVQFVSKPYLAQIGLAASLPQ